MMARHKLTDLSGVGEATAAKLAARGFATVATVAEATPTALQTVPGIGAARAASLRDQAATLERRDSEEDSDPQEESGSGGKPGKGKKKKKKKKKDKKGGKKGKSGKRGKKRNKKKDKRRKGRDRGTRKNKKNKKGNKPE
jgi:NAD-dependent DNA ligase